MTELREDFGLMEYSEEFVRKMIDYRMYKDRELNRYLTFEEIAERENADVNDVRRVISATAIVWNH